MSGDKLRAVSFAGDRDMDHESVAGPRGKGALKARAEQTHDAWPDVLFKSDLAKLLRTSVRTLNRRMRAGADLPPEMPRIGRSPRWLRSVVEQWMQPRETPVELRYFKQARGGRR